MLYDTSGLIFLSTLSLRRATAADMSARREASISIHALLAESDDFRRAVKCGIAYFYPRSPCGERQFRKLLYPGSTNFYPRSPCGERPVHFVGLSALAPISIHALLAESDIYTHPVSVLITISIHALLAESDCLFCVKLQLPLIFLSTLSLRRATPVGVFCIT